MPCLFPGCLRSFGKEAFLNCAPGSCAFSPLCDSTNWEQEKYALTVPRANSNLGKGRHFCPWVGSELKVDLMRSGAAHINMWTRKLLHMCQVKTYNLTHVSVTHLIKLRIVLPHRQQLSCGVQSSPTTNPIKPALPQSKRTQTIASWFYFGQNFMFFGFFSEDYSSW